MNVEELTKAIEFMIDNPMKIIEYGNRGYFYTIKKSEIQKNIQIRLNNFRKL